MHRSFVAHQPPPCVYWIQLDEHDGDEVAVTLCLQVMVYTLLLSELYGTHVPAGLLFYPQLASSADQGLFVTVAEPALIASLMMLRNELVGGAAPHSYLQGRMPLVLRSESACGRCAELQVTTSPYDTESWPHPAPASSSTPYVT